MHEAVPAKGLSKAVKEQLDRVLSSRHFANAERLSRFLRYTVEQTLEGKSDQLKEYTIAIEVFDRQDWFDPRTDSSVRVQAVKLRQRLRDYYAEEGADDPVAILFTKGSYVPKLAFRRVPDKVPEEHYDPPSIAVLPFVNMSADPENEYFSDGLTEELISTICNTGGIRVVARTSVFQFKGKAVDVREIGAQLNTSMVLEGSVRKDGDSLRVTVQLSDATSGYQKWSRTYRVEMKDLFSVQEEIARAIAATLTDQGRHVIRRPTSSLDAYDLYLKGRFHLNKWTPQSFQKSAEFFAAAVEKDRDMAVAYAGLADARFVLACYGKIDSRELMPRARMAALRALELNDSLAEPHVSLGAVQAAYGWDWAGSEREFQKAIALNGDYAVAHQWYGVLCLMPQGRLAEAVASIQRAQELDPLSPPISTSLGLAHFLRGEQDDAVACFQQALKLEPNFHLAHWWLGVIYLERSRPMKALAQFRKSGLLSPTNPAEKGLVDATKFTYGDALVGRGGKARKLLEVLERLSRETYFSPVIIASIHVVLGDTNGAFEWLEKGCEVRDPWLVWIGLDRRFDRIRTDPRFQQLLDRIGIGEALRARTSDSR